MSLERSPSRNRRAPRRGRYQPLLIPILDAFEVIGVGHTKGYQMVKDGLIETVMVGKRRYATRAGLEKLASPQQQNAA
jgi:hypothetical protein